MATTKVITNGGTQVAAREAIDRLVPTDLGLTVSGVEGLTGARLNSIAQALRKAIDAAGGPNLSSNRTLIASVSMSEATTFNYAGEPTNGGLTIDVRISG